MRPDKPSVMRPSLMRIDMLARLRWPVAPLDCVLPVLGDLELLHCVEYVRSKHALGPVSVAFSGICVAGHRVSLGLRFWCAEFGWRMNGLSWILSYQRILCPFGPS